MDKKTLIYNKPKYNTYNYLAASSIVGENNPYFDIWCHNNYIDIQCSRNDFSKGLNLTLCKGSILELPFLYLLSMGTMYPLNRLFECIRNLIDDDFYVYFDNVDDFYIKGKTHYQEKHYPHDGLIIGYDDIEQTYQIAAYNNNFMFDLFTISQKEFAEGFSYGFFRAYDTGRMPELYGVRVDPEKETYKATIDKEHIDSRIKTYLAPHLDTEYSETPHVAFGIDIYDSIIDFLGHQNDSIVTNSSFIKDPRIFKMLYEHKLSMKERMGYIFKNYDIPLSLNPYEEIVDRTNRLHFLYAKYFKDHKAKTIEWIINELLVIKENEITLLNQYLNF